MQKNKIIFSFLGVLIILVGVTIFIKNSNDHKECDVVIEPTKDTRGNTVTIKKHICKENFNF